MSRFLYITLISFLLMPVAQAENVITGDLRTELYFPLLKGKKIAVYSNATGMAGDKHVVDLLVENNMDVKAILAPEHGFRLKADAGEHVSNEVDEATGIPIISLYGRKDKRPLKDLIADYDIVITDIQDVGLRYYTYYVTMLKLMNACAESQKKMIVLDRPNPNGFYVDGPILDMKHKSGVGGLPIPIVHGMTLGELALMINGEHWLNEFRICDLSVIPCANYTHKTHYDLPIAPSPNLPNMKSVYLYSSICFFEGTCASLGRGTEAPFQLFGHPDMKGYSFSFTPQSVSGAKNPPLLGKKCYGVDLRQVPDKKIWKEGVNLAYIIEAYNAVNMGESFFTRFFEKLIGVDYVRQMIVAGKSAKEIKACWKEDVKKFKKQRRPYLLYSE